MAPAIRTYASFSEVRDVLCRFLSRHELEHNMLLAFVDRQGDRPFAPGRVLALAHHGVEVVGAVVGADRHEHLLVLSRMPGDAARSFADALALEAFRVSRLTGPPQSAAPFAEQWSLRTGAIGRKDLEMRLLALRALRPCAECSGSATVATAQHRDLVRRWTDGFCADIGEARLPDERIAALLAQGAISLWFDAAGSPCSMAAVVREAPSHAMISLVYTPESLRGRGHATACVGALCRRALAAGKTECALYADARNRASNRVYERLGFEERARSWRYEFHSSARGQRA
jgi:RimJ/RimL family protein N-acetyltransferase